MAGLTYLQLTNFKSFANAEITFAPFSLVVGANGAGKSNIRDSLRFLHALCRGINLQEAINGKLEGGIRVWTGIRGGCADICLHGQDELSIRATVGDYNYSITIEFVGPARVPKLVDESLNGPDGRLFRTKTSAATPKDHIEIVLVADGLHGGQIKTIQRNDTALGEIPRILEDKGGADENAVAILAGVKCLHDVFGKLRFSQFSPDAMRKPTPAIEKELGRRGENLSSALQAICQNDKRRDRLASWLRRLTSMDVGDFDFSFDRSGRVLLNIVERNGQMTSLESISDGTLRFLAILVAMASPDTGITYFIEEIDSGIHPSRFADLMEILQAQTTRERATIIATTHSSALLRLLGRRRLHQAHICYRLKGDAHTRITCLEDIPHIRDKLERYDLGLLHETAWFRKTLAAGLKEEAPA